MLLPSILCFLLVFIFLFWLLIGACVCLYDDDVNINVISIIDLSSCDDELV